MRALTRTFIAYPAVMVILIACVPLLALDRVIRGSRALESAIGGLLDAATWVMVR